MRVVNLILATALVACSQSAPGSEGSATPATPTAEVPFDTADTATAVPKPLLLEVGVGEAEFISVNDGDDVWLFHGPAVGWHVSLAARVGNINPPMTVLATPRIIVDGTQVAGADDRDTIYAGLFPLGDSEGEFWGFMVHIDDLWPNWAPHSEVCTWEGDDVVVELEVEDYATGRVAIERVNMRAVLMTDEGPFDCGPFK